MSQTETLQAELSAERVSFTETLAAGGDTTTHRQRIADLEGQIAAVERQAREERAAASRAEAATVEHASAVLAVETHAAVDAAANVPGLAELTGEALPAVPEDPAIAAAAREVARCRAHLERAGAELKPHQEQADKLAARLAEKQTCIDVIKRRRLTGDERAGDAGELLALTGDAEALQLLADDARMKALAVDTRPPARSALASAEQQLAQARRQAEFDSLLKRVRQAEAVFIAA